MSNQDAIRQVIEPPRGFIRMNWAELWNYRELLYFLTWRDIKIRYKQTVLGFLWAFLQPFIQMLIFTLIFGVIIGIDTKDGTPYAVFVFAGLLPWQFFSQALSQSGNSVVASANLVTKVYFPRLIIPIASTGGHIFTLLISLLIMIGLMLVYGIAPTAKVLLCIPLILLTLLTTLSVGILFSVLTTAYRDFRNMLGFIIQLWFYLTPVIYPVKFIPEDYRWLSMLNPMAGIVNGFRSAFLDYPIAWGHLGISAGTSILLLVFSLYFFRRMEHRFADIV